VSARLELETLRDSFATAKAQYDQDVAVLGDKLDAELERAERLAAELVDAEHTIEELRLQLADARADVQALSAQRDRAADAAREVEEQLGKDRDRTINRLVEQHERELVMFLTERDGAMEEAQRAQFEAASAAHQLLAERKMLDDLLAESASQADKLVAERDLAAEQARDLAETRRAAEAELRELEAHLIALEDERRRQASKLDDELLAGHEKQVAVLARQRDEALSQRDSVADQVEQAKREAAQAAAALEQERERAAKLAGDRETAALRLDRLASEQESSTRRAAELQAEHDDVVARLLQNHERELASARRQLEFAKEQGRNAERDIAALKETIARLVSERADDYEEQLATALHERDVAVQQARHAQQDIAALKATISHLLADPESVDDPESEDIEI
jgi:chromosome segregation ATPase